jgi:hypothetical protein
MEDEDVWKNSFGYMPSECGGLPKMLDERAVQYCKLNPEGMNY